MEKNSTALGTSVGAARPSRAVNFHQSPSIGQVLSQGPFLPSSPFDPLTSLLTRSRASHFILLFIIFFFFASARVIWKIPAQGSHPSRSNPGSLTHCRGGTKRVPPQRGAGALTHAAATAGPPRCHFIDEKFQAPRNLPHIVVLASLQSQVCLRPNLTSFPKSLSSKDLGPY